MRRLRRVRKAREGVVDDGDDGEAEACGGVKEMREGE